MSYIEYSIAKNASVSEINHLTQKGSHYYNIVRNMKAHSIGCKVRLCDTKCNNKRKNGGNDMLETIYEEYNRYIYHLCLKLTRNTVEAEDLMQEVWVKVVRYESYVESVDHIKAWLTTITMNTFRDRYRKNVRRSKYMMHQPETLDVPVLDLVANQELST